MSSGDINNTKILQQQYQQYLVVYGGASPEKGPLSDTFVALLPSEKTASEFLDKDDVYVHWIKLQPPAMLQSNNSDDIAAAAIGPGCREMHGTAFSLYDNIDGAHGSTTGSRSMIISGGRDGENLLDDVWELCQPSGHDSDGGVFHDSIKLAAIVTDHTPIPTDTSDAATTTTKPIIMDITEALGTDSAAVSSNTAARANKEPMTTVFETTTTTQVDNDDKTSQDTGKDKTNITTTNEDLSHLLQWKPRKDLTLSSPRCAHGSTILDCSILTNTDITTTTDSTASNMPTSCHLLGLIGGFMGESIAEDLASIALSHQPSSTNTTTKWKSIGCGAAIGMRFGTAVCTAPKWLLDIKFPEAKNTNINSSAMIIYGGINIEKDFNDLIILLPPTIPISKV